MPVSLTGKSENFPTCVATTKLISLWTTANVTFGTSALQIFYGGQFTWSTQLLKPNYHVIPSPPPLPQNHSFLVVVVKTDPLYQKTHLSMRIKRKRNWWKYIGSGYHLYNIEDQPKSSSSPSFPAISVAWVNRHRRKKERNTRCCGNSGKKINALPVYNQILSASLPKNLNCIALKVLCYFFPF